MRIGTYRLIPKNTEFWSIKNQAMISMNENAIIEVKCTCTDNDFVFVKPMQLLFNIPGFIPTLIGKGTDEWSLSYSKTLPYTVPKPIFWQI